MVPGTFLAVVFLWPLGLLSACRNTTNDTPPPPSVNATVNFPTITSGATIDFSPTGALPAGVTYVLRDDQGNTWNSTGFSGQVTASSYYSVAGHVNFTQTFYLYGVEITNAGSKRTVTSTITTFPSISIFISC